jgi:hypothetical protein
MFLYCHQNAGQYIVNIANKAFETVKKSKYLELQQKSELHSRRN